MNYKNPSQANAEHELIPVSGRAHKNLTISTTALGIGELHADTRYILLTVNTETVRVTFDGNDPTATDGHLLSAGDERKYSREAALALKMIRGGGTDANVAVTELTR